MTIFNKNSPVWLTGFGGFEPEHDGIFGFTLERRSSSLHAAQ